MQSGRYAFRFHCCSCLLISEKNQGIKTCQRKMEYQVSKGGDFIVVTSVEIELQLKVLSCENNPSSSNWPVIGLVLPLF